MKRALGAVVLTLLFAAGVAPVALAETLVVVTDSGVEPRVVTAWEADGREVELSLRGDAEPSEVAAAIEDGIDRVKAKVRAGKVVVLGKSLEELLPLLAVIDVGGGDSISELDELAAADADFGSGSSLRAKKKAAVDAEFADPERTLVGQVLAVAYGEYPRTRVKLRVLQSPRGDLGDEAARGRVIVVVPRILREDGAVQWGDSVTRMNAGAWYLEPEDRVRVRIGAADAPGGSDEAFVAEAIAR